MDIVNYSVIIPHKNIPQLLQRCLESIPKRKDIQIIIIDDNSDPNKVDFSLFPGKNDKSVEIHLTKEGLGAGYARNVGLEYAKGKWVLFADADDFFVKNFTDLLDPYLNSDADIVFFDVESRDLETGKLTDEGKRISTFLHSFTYGDRTTMLNLIFNHEVPWGKMIRREFICNYNIKFDEVLASNDTMFMLKSLFKANKILFCDDVLYCWSIRKNSLVHSINRDIIFSRYEVDLRRNRFCIDAGHKEYTRSIAFWILQISKLGCKDLIKAINLCFRYKINPFTKCKNWIKHVSK